MTAVHISRRMFTEEDRENLDTFMKEDSDIERYMDAYMMNVTLEHGSDEHDAYLTILADPDKSEEYFSFHDRISKEEYPPFRSRCDH